MLDEVLEGKLGAFANRIGKLMFKLIVNNGMLTHILAAGSDVDLAVLDKLRIQCVNEAKQTHGAVEFKDAYLFEQEL